MKNASLRLTAAAFLALCCAATAQTSGDVAALKDEIQAMRAAYEAQIAALEARLEKLETAVAEAPSLPPTPPDEAALAALRAIITNTLATSSGEPYSQRSLFTSAIVQPHADAPPKLELGQEFASLAPGYNGFAYEGYFRSGFGVNSRGGKMQAFKAPHAPAKFRLGNEDDTYLEMRFNLRSWSPDSNGLRVELPIRLAYSTNMDGNDTFSLGEIFARVSNFSTRDPDMAIWAGRRFYRQPQPHMDDFWFYDLTGYGGGIDTISVGEKTKLALAYLGYSDNDSWYHTQRGLLAKNNLSAILYGFDLLGGTGTAWANYGYLRGGDHLDTTTLTLSDYDSFHGFDAGLMHVSHPGENIRNQLSLQFGYGANISLSSGAILPVAYSVNGEDRYGFAYDQDAHTFRAINDTTFQWTDRLGMEMVGIYQYTDNGRGDTTQWLSFGVRPLWHFHKYFGIELEPGIDYVDDDATGDSSFLFKGTVALRIAPDGRYSTRPAIRLFATYARWGSDFEGQIAPDAFFGRREGLNFGVQAEHWW